MSIGCARGRLAFDRYNREGDQLNIFVGNLAPEVTEKDLSELFSRFGQVKSVQLPREIFTDRPGGFAFVEMPGKAHSLAAIANLNGKDLAGRPMRVNESQARPVHGRRR